MKFEDLDSIELKNIIISMKVEMRFMDPIIEHSLNKSNNDIEFILLFSSILSTISGFIDSSLSKILLAECKIYDLNIELEDMYDIDEINLLKKLKFARKLYEKGK